ncbi:MAG TPA: prolyl oligopeptidase family serine peptidase [Candidatus Polarisedimenticolia bacterium]
MRREPDRDRPRRSGRLVPAAASLGSALLLASGLAMAAKESQSDMTPKLPPPSRSEETAETIHGVRVADPYRWLENGSSPEVGRWVEAQNAYAGELLEARPGRRVVRKRLESLLSIGTVGVPEVRGNRYFYTKREGKTDQPILYVRDGLHGADRALVDPNKLSKDGTAALDWWYPSEDGSLLAYGVSTSGDEKSTLQVLTVATGALHPDTIPRTRYCSLAWLPDGGGFYYTRYPAPGEAPAGGENYNRHVFFHRLGDDPAKDPKIFGQGRKPEEMIEISLSRDGRYLVLSVAEGWARNDLYVRDLTLKGGAPIAIAEGQDALFQGEVEGETLYLMTNWGAPRFRLFAVDLRKPGRDDWKLVIPESSAVLNQARYVGGRIAALYLKDASSRLSLYAPDGKKLQDVTLPMLGTIESVSGRHDGKEAFFDFSSFTMPPAVYRLDLATGIGDIWERVTSDVDLRGFEVKQVFYPSKDGTRVSMFLVHRKGLVQDGDNPTLLYGYGGFNINMTPAFSRANVLWLERGGVYAQPNLRGGGEYGEAWHRAGMLGQKQNVFDDFIAAGEWLIANRYTSSDRLAIRGGSNGGLLVGAALTQRPDLFRAVVCAVPLLDMLRYQNFQIARLWIPEYGSAESADAFRWLYAYSPYHHVTPGTSYPSVLIMTADSDSRVDPMHARKMAARLQSATGSSGHPILLRTESKAGHGVGKPLSKMIDDATDEWTFLLWQLDAEGERPAHRSAAGAV